MTNVATISNRRRRPFRAV